MACEALEKGDRQEAGKLIRSRYAFDPPVDRRRAFTKFARTRVFLRDGFLDRYSGLVYGDGARMQQLGGALGSFTKTARKEYRRHQWPFKAIAPSGERRTWQYVMYEDTAEKVRRLARGKSDAV
jgi:hypothetical protein